MRSVLSFFCFLAASVGSAQNLPHLDLNMDGFAYRALWQDHGPVAFDDEPLAEILTIGQRNLAWLEAVNGTRPPELRLELSTPETTRGIPIDSPNEYSRETILASKASVFAQLPERMRDVLLGTAEIPTSGGMPDELFLGYVRQVDTLYQYASRWLLMEPWLEQYAERAHRDIRGYYFLQQEDDLAGKLRNWNKLDAATRDRLFPLLINLCGNSEKTATECEKELVLETDSRGSAYDFYQNHLLTGQEIYASYFRLQNPRPEAVFTKDNPNQFILPFLKPDNERVALWLKENVEEEWQRLSFKLTLDFKDKGENIGRLVFEPGATPHVNGLGGDVITMDANRDIDEYLVRWTIRHEFGHVLGFPDCYLEFYDKERGLMIAYQIDLEDIMCARTGHLGEHHVEELKRAYWERSFFH